MDKSDANTEIGNGYIVVTAGKGIKATEIGDGDSKPTVRVRAITGDVEVERVGRRASVKADDGNINVKGDVGAGALLEAKIENPTKPIRGKGNITIGGSIEPGFPNPGNPDEYNDQYHVQTKLHATRSVGDASGTAIQQAEGIEVQSGTHQKKGPRQGPPQIP